MKGSSLRPHHAGRTVKVWKDGMFDLLLDCDYPNAIIACRPNNSTRGQYSSMVIRFGPKYHQNQITSILPNDVIELEPKNADTE